MQSKDADKCRNKLLTLYTGSEYPGPIIPCHKILSFLKQLNPNEILKLQKPQL